MKDPDDVKPLKQQSDGPYESPKVIRVSLRPDEAVLGHCKVSGSTGAVHAGCFNGIMVCRTFGS